MTHLKRLARRSFFLALPTLSFVALALLASACGGSTKGSGDRGSGGSSTQSLGSALAFPVGVETSCSAVLMQISPNIEAGGVFPAISPTVTLTSSGNVVTATINGTTSPLAPLQFTAISGASATVVAAQAWTLPVSTITPSSMTSPDENESLTIAGGSLTFTGDSFFLSVEMPLSGSQSPGTMTASLECTAAGTAPADCVCPGAEVCACASAATPPPGVYTACSTYLSDPDAPGGAGSEGGDTTVTLVAQDGEVTVTLGGGPDPAGLSVLHLTPTSGSTATIAAGQTFNGPGAARSSASCTPGGDLWMAPEWPVSVNSGSLVTDGQWLTISIEGTSPCSTAQRLAVVCPTRTQ